ncbi:CD63 antigen isoform X2 [Rhinatrema bivittatum]|uniref:CD63 antigen isoform X2 n=1 Tax=Rhinatrema bivittatum TaxID=194408 RepID=UPI00112CBA86|nr:CD63 antigen isoform X2 [Rhinatrema bivittatum]XP_029450552.1 CD63 antigen isoform X2 [Rhinatrema bivittatum]
MAVEGGMKCVKFLVFFFNFIFWLCGLALIVVGVIVQVKLNNSIIIKNASASGAPIVIIIVGVVIFFVAFFGCCGAWKENYCMVTTFAILLTLIFLVEIAAAIAGYVFKNKVNDFFRQSFVEGMAKYNTTIEVKEALDGLQRDFKCCGENGSTDWANYAPFNKSGGVPDSCCQNETAGCGKASPPLINTEGCVEKINTWIKNNVVVIAGVALGIAFLELLGIVFACCLMKGIRSGYEVM